MPTVQDLIINIIGSHDIYDCLISMRIFTLTMNKISLSTANEYMHGLDILIISHLVV